MSEQRSAHRPDLDRSVEILPGTDVDDAWNRFEIFEALHHTMQICNPMTTDELDEAVAALDLSDGMRIVDLACGYGELLFRAAAVADISGIGVDLSPWMINAASTANHQRAPAAHLRWVLGEARDYACSEPTDVAVCVGAEWIWHDFAGTARALSQRLDANGLAVIGAARLHHLADQESTARDRGRIDTIDDQARLLDACGLEPLHRIDPDDAGWDAYLERTRLAALEWARIHPGARSRRWIEEQQDWHRARERDRDVIGWSVWVARKRDDQASGAGTIGHGR